MPVPRCVDPALCGSFSSRRGPAEDERSVRILLLAALRLARLSDEATVDPEEEVRLKGGSP